MVYRGSRRSSSSRSRSSSSSRSRSSSRSSSSRSSSSSRKSYNPRSFPSSKKTTSSSSRRTYNPASKSAVRSTINSQGNRVNRTAPRSVQSGTFTGASGTKFNIGTSNYSSRSGNYRPYRYADGRTTSGKPMYYGGNKSLGAYQTTTQINPQTGEKEAAVVPYADFLRQTGGPDLRTKFTNRPGQSYDPSTLTARPTLTPQQQTQLQSGATGMPSPTAFNSPSLTQGNDYNAANLQLGGSLQQGFQAPQQGVTNPQFNNQGGRDFDPGNLQSNYTDAFNQTFSTANSLLEQNYQNDVAANTSARDAAKTLAENQKNEAVRQYQDQLAIEKRENIERLKANGQIQYNADGTMTADSIQRINDVNARYMKMDADFSAQQDAVFQQASAQADLDFSQNMSQLGQSATDTRLGFLGERLGFDKEYLALQDQRRYNQQQTDEDRAYQLQEMQQEQVASYEKALQDQNFKAQLQQLKYEQDLSKAGVQSMYKIQEAQMKAQNQQIVDAAKIRLQESFKNQVTPEEAFAMAEKISNAPNMASLQFMLSQLGEDSGIVVDPETLEMVKDAVARNDMMQQAAENVDFLSDYEDLDMFAGQGNTDELVSIFD